MDWESTPLTPKSSLNLLKIGSRKEHLRVLSGKNLYFYECFPFLFSLTHWFADILTLRLNLIHWFDVIFHQM